MKQNSKSRGVTLRAIMLSLALIPINNYWILYMETGVWWMQYPTTMSMFFNAVFILFVLACLNLAAKKWLARWAFSQGELLTVYVMLNLASAVCATDMIQVLMPMLGHPFWFASPENEWEELFWRYLPRWLMVSDKSVLTDYYNGDSTFYAAYKIKAWLSPVLWWTGFFFALLFVMLCINVLVRRQWTEREKLAYPIAQLPYEFTIEGGQAAFFKDRLFWLAFGIVGVIDLINSLNYFIPAVPKLVIRTNLSIFFTEKPWNAIGWTPFAFYPFIIGLGYFMPLDLSFSCWFFYLFRKSQMVLSSILGLRSLPGFPYDREQSLGAYIGLSLFALWASRNHIKGILKAALFRSEDDKAEPLRYRTALLGILGGIAFIVFFFLKMGMSLWVILLAFLIYYALSVGITRMRAESGAPAHDLHFMGPDYAIPAAVGTRKLGGANLTALTFLYSFNRAHRAHPMPHQLEGFKLAERSKMDGRRLAFAMSLAVLVGLLASFWIYLDVSYRFGGSAWTGWESFNRLQRWLTYPSGTDYPAVSFIGVGMLFSIFLQLMRTRLFWWPFHAVGYAVSGAADWCMNWIWASLLVSSIIKWLLLRHGGVKAYRKAVPLFIGMVLGEFVVGSVFSIGGLIFGTRVYAFKNW
jgi:hypothetical protein